MTCHWHSAAVCAVAIVITSSVLAQVSPTAPLQQAPPAGAHTSASAPALDKLDIRAQLSPRRYTTLAAEIPARVARIAIREGESFKAGQSLISLDCGLHIASRDRARAALTSAEKTYSANKRLDELNAVGKLEVDTAEAEVGKFKAELAHINTTLSKCSIAAPYAGRVAEQKAREQQYVQAGQPLLEILDDSVLELDFLSPSRWLSWLKIGHKFDVVIDETGKTYPARIQRLGARIDPVSQSIKVAAVIDGRFPDLIAGMSGRILLAAPKQP